MSSNLAHERARESAGNWLANRKLENPTPPRVSGAWAETAMADAYAAGWTEAVASCAAVHREEQDQWDDQRRIGQQQLDDATALMRETAELLRGYEEHHRAKVPPEAIRCKDAVPGGAFEKAERNGLAAARLEAWLDGADRYPVSLNPAEVLRGIAEETAELLGLGVDHESFDQAARSLDQLELPAGEPGEPIPEVGGIVVRCRECGASQTVLRYTSNGDAYLFGEDADGLVPGEDTLTAHGEPARFDNIGPAPPLSTASVKRSARAALHDAARFEGRSARLKGKTVADCPSPGGSPAAVSWLAGWSEADAHVPPDAASGTGLDPEITEALVASAGGETFRLTTGDPQFDPQQPVRVNGYLYLPTKETTQWS